MGEASKRKALGLGFKTIDPHILLASQAQLYKKTEQLRPDMGMALALVDYSQPLMIGCFAPYCTGDIEWDVSIGGVLSSYGKVGNNVMPSIPVIFDGYFFTVALNNSDELSKSEVMGKLKDNCLIVRIEPKYKYLAPTKREWVLPLVPVNYGTQA